MVKYEIILKQKQKITTVVKELLSKKVFVKSLKETYQKGNIKKDINTF